jgi:hypothetical protein
MFAIFFTVYYTIPNEKIGKRNHPTQPCWLGENSVPINKKCYTLLVLTLMQIKKKKYANIDKLIIFFSRSFLLKKPGSIMLSYNLLLKPRYT